VKRIPMPVVLAALSVLILALSACERPAPGGENRIEATATTAGILAPTLPLATPGLPASASPTPLPVPVEASPTPLPPVVEPSATPQQPAVDPTASASGEIIHVVQAGENLYRIGLRYGFTVQELATYNGITNPDVLAVGQQIRIPPSQ